MINYVNNAFDKVLKPCDAQKFSIIVNSQETEKRILGHRGGDPKAKSKLPAITYMGVLDREKYRKYLVQCKEQDTKPLGSRRAEFMRPTGLLMLDFDHVGRLEASPLLDSSQASLLGRGKPLFVATDAHTASAQGGVTQTASTIDSPVKLWEYIYSHPSLGGDGGGRIALAHITPSGDGLRLVLKREKGKSIQQEQYDFCQAMEVKCDDVCKDISRLSFAPMKSEILYFNPSLLFGELPEESDYPDGTLWGTPSNLPADPLPTSPSMGRGQSPSPTNKGNTPEALPIEGELSEGLWGSDFKGIPYSEIVRRLEEQLGGAPAQGARNSFIFTMACNLRYICNDDAAWVASILPTYGEEPQKHRQTIQSAINRPMSRNMPETLKRALMVSAESVEVNSAFKNQHSALPPALPSALPEPIALLTSCTPEKMKPAVAMALFPPLGAHMYDTRFTYLDERDYEPTFMNVVVAELSSGKSAVNKPIEYITADMRASDTVVRSKMRQWRESCATMSNTKDRPERPKGLYVQVLSADMTNAAFVQRLADAEGHFLYTQMDEIELLDALKTNTRGGSVSAILRLAFDCGDYGQERVAASAIDAQVKVRWNWNASTTIQRVRKYFAKNIADGTLSRLSFATIIKDDDDWGEQRPRFGRYGERFADELCPYIDRLTTCRGTLHCPEAIGWAEALSDEMVAFARDVEDRSYAQMSFRAVLMGFFRAMLLYVMNGMRWTSEIADFAAWSVKYDMWCKMRFFRDMLHNDIEGERAAIQRGPVGLLTMLPREFTREQVRDLRIAQGLKSDPTRVLYNWVQRGLAARMEDGTYIKL